jgi:IclR family acetate operon transcriptional repressor
MVKKPPRRISDDQYIVRSVVRAAELLRAFQHDGESLRLTDLAQRTGLHKTTAFRLLTSLEAGGLVSRAAADRYQSKVAVPSVSLDLEFRRIQHGQGYGLGLTWRQRNADR